MYSETGVNFDLDQKSLTYCEGFREPEQNTFKL